jgi:hypothetical protein
VSPDVQQCAEDQEQAEQIVLLQGLTSLRNVDVILSRSLGLVWVTRKHDEQRVQNDEQYLRERVRERGKPEQNGKRFLHASTPPFV